MQFFFQLFLPQQFLTLSGAGTCVCPEGYFPVSDSVQVKTLNALESFAQPEEAPDLFQLNPRFNAERIFDRPRNARSNFPRLDFKFGCECEDSCGNKVEGSFVLDRKDSQFNGLKGTVS